MSVILGINAFHADSAACLVVDGKLKAAVAEERLGRRVKHCPDFPGHAIRWVLAHSGLTLKDVTHVAFARSPRANLGAKVRYVLSAPAHSARAVLEHRRRNRKTHGVLGQLDEICGLEPGTARYRLVGVEHHLAHVASAYYLSPFEATTAGFSFDASGDFASALIARCEGTKIHILDRVCLPDSLGFFYTATCQFIGFDAFGEEYKVMGLAAFGEDRHADFMGDLVQFDERSWYRLNRRYFGMHDGGESGGLDAAGSLRMGRLYSDLWEMRLGPARVREAPITDRERDLARSCQVHFERVTMHCMERLHRLVPVPRIAYAGGCALNGVANARLLRESPFRQAYIQSAASDDGTCLGAAFYCYHNVVGGIDRFQMEHAYWGPEYDERRLASAAASAGLSVRQLERDPLLELVARLLSEGRIVGWYQGRSEWGPRALGNRSILADPTRRDMKDILNRKIKRRESFRPFAPSVLVERVGDYFEQAIASPFMMHVVKIRSEWRDRLPAITHVDGTGRLQTVERHQNPLYYDLIQCFAARSGVAILLNTSFNENEPIVDTPEQAVDCFRRTSMDVLVLGNHVVLRNEDALDCAPRLGHLDRSSAG